MQRQQCEMNKRSQSHRKKREKEKEKAQCKNLKNRPEVSNERGNKKKKSPIEPQQECEREGASARALLLRECREERESDKLRLD